MSRPAGLRRPKSQFLTNAESTAKRLTRAFHHPSTDDLSAAYSQNSLTLPFKPPVTTPPTPPPGPQSRASSFYGPPPSIESRHPSLSLPYSYSEMPLPSPKPSIHSFADRSYAGSLNARRDFTPSSAVFGPDGSILQAPVAPFAMESRASSRPSSRGSMSRPGTSSALSIGSPGQAKPIEIPRQRKKRTNRLNKDGKEVECWRLVPNSGANAPLVDFDVSPLIRGERVS